MLIIFLHNLHNLHNFNINYAEMIIDKKYIKRIIMLYKYYFLQYFITNICSDVMQIERKLCLNLSRSTIYSKNFRTQGKADTINLEQLITFLNEKQRDPTLNEILYPLYDEKRALEIINDYERNKVARKESKSLINHATEAKRFS